jgi:hypothetical protein
LAQDHNCKIILLHVPLDVEFSDTSVPELTGWVNQFGSGPMMIAAPSAQLFAGMDRPKFLHFYRDAHLNENGSRYFTNAIIPALMRAYDQSAIANGRNYAR